MTAFVMEIRDNQSTPFTRAGNLGKEANITGVRQSTILPGGCERVTFRAWIGQSRTIFTPPSYLGYNFDLRLYDDKLCNWSGRIEEIIAHHGTGGNYFDVTAFGQAVALDDLLYTATDVAGVQTSAGVNTAVALANKITVRTITATGFTLSGATAITLKMLTLAQVVNWFSLFGDTSDNPQMWYVYPQPNGDIEFTFKPRPTTADVKCQLLQFEESSWGLIGRQYANRAIAQFADGASVSTVNDTGEQAVGPTGRGITRTASIFIPEITQTADADQAAQVLLNAVVNLRMNAQQLRCKSNVQFIDANGQKIPPWRVRAGQLLEFTDIAPAEGQMGTFTYNNAALIAATEWDEDAQTLSLTPENFDLFMEREIARAKKLLSGRHTTAGGL